MPVGFIIWVAGGVVVIIEGENGKGLLGLLNHAAKGL
jgi:hypothetical protein